MLAETQAKQKINLNSAPLAIRFSQPFAAEVTGGSCYELSYQLWQSRKAQGSQDFKISKLSAAHILSGCVCLSKLGQHEIKH